MSVPPTTFCQKAWWLAFWGEANFSVPKHARKRSFGQDLRSWSDSKRRSARVFSTACHRFALKFSDSERPIVDVRNPGTFLPHVLPEFPAQHHLHLRTESGT